MNYKIDDIIIFNKKASLQYCLTIEGVIGKIIYIIDSERSKILILSGIKDRDQIGRSYNVTNEFFDLHKTKKGNIFINTSIKEF